jgi:hypothetical protein
MTYRQFSARVVGLRSVSLVLASVAVCAACGGSSFGSGGGDAGTSAGGSSTAGASGSTSSAGTSGSTAGGSAGSGSGGTAAAGASAGGAGGAANCDTLKADYAAALEKARGCDSGSTDECSPSSTLPAIGCGCAALVNSKSDFTTIAKQKYQAIQDAKCASGPICNIACLSYTSASCSAQMTAAGTAYQCTGTMGVTAN